MDKNFRVRIIVGFSMFVVAIVALYTFDSIPFKIIYGLFALMALFELAFIIASTVFVARVNIDHFWYIILGVCGYDIFAYLFGKLFGGKVFKKPRPFPHVSKNKTWEGTILGLTMAICLCLVTMSLRGSLSTDWMYLLCGPLALIGDLFESFMKRKFSIKDSNEIVRKNKVFEKAEMLVGGSEGHGGFLDRIDSTAFATTILLIISLAV